MTSNERLILAASVLCTLLGGLAIALMVAAVATDSPVPVFISFFPLAEATWIALDCRKQVRSA